MATVAPYGTWTSPISAQTVAAQGLRLGFVALDGDDIYWLEGRPHEGGRNALVKRRADGAIADVTPRDHNVRTRVHEYGGGAYVVSNGVVYYSNFVDQRIYRIARSRGAKTPRDADPPEPITPEGKWFYADAAIDERRQRLICVREDHSREGHEPVTTLVSIPLDQSAVGSGQSEQGRAVGRRDHRVGLRLLLDATPESRRIAACVAVVAPSADAVGRHRALGCRCKRHRHAR